MAHTGRGLALRSRPAHRALALLSTLAVALASPACGPRVTAHDTTLGSLVASMPSARWPAYAHVAEGTRLRMHTTRSETPFGWLARGVRVELVGVPLENLVAVHATGALELWGFAPVRELGVTTCTAARIDGAPVLATGGDELRLRGPLAGERATVPVEAEVRLPVPPSQQRSLTFTGEIAATALCHTPDDRWEPSSNPPVSVLANRSIALHERPEGPVLYTLPASEFGYVFEARGRRDGWVNVLVGFGPYLDVWMRTVDTDPRPAAWGAGGLGVRSTEGVPLVLRSERWSHPEQPLHRVPRGTLVMLDGLRVGQLTRDGWARVQGARDGHLSVTVAADDNAWANGWILASALGAMVEQGRPASSAANPATAPARPTPVP